MKALLVFVPVLLCGLASHACAAPRIYEGDLVVEQSNQACINDGFNVGNYNKIIYAYFNNTDGDNDALSIITGRALFRTVSTDASHSLNGPVAGNDTVVNGSAGLFSYASSSNLAITTVGGNSLATGVNLKIIGSINDFFVKNCTITFHALLIVRPNQ